MKKIGLSIVVATIIVSATEMDTVIKVSEKVITRLIALEARFSKMETNFKNYNQRTISLEAEVSRLNKVITLNSSRKVVVQSAPAPVAEYVPSVYDKTYIDEPVVTYNEPTYVAPRLQNQVIYPDPYASITEKKKVYKSSGVRKYVIYLGSFKSKSRANYKFNRLKRIDSSVFMVKRHGKYFLKMNFKGTQNSFNKINLKLKKIVPDLFWKRSKL